MKHLSLLFITVIGLLATNARAQFIHDMDGKPFTQKNYVDVKGSPYLVDAWAEGVVKLANGTTYKQNLLIKFDLAGDKLFFKDSGDQMLEFVQPVSEFTITYTENNESVTKRYRSGYADIKNSTPASFFELISDGTVQLIKKVTKTILETKPFNSATVEKDFVDYTRYYLVINGKAVPVKNDKKSILAALPDKQQQVQDYLKTNTINFKADTDLAKLINYYNSL